MRNHAARKGLGSDTGNAGHFAATEHPRARVGLKPLDSWVAQPEAMMRNDGRVVCSIEFSNPIRLEVHDAIHAGPRLNSRTAFDTIHEAHDEANRVTASAHKYASKAPLAGEPTPWGPAGHVYPGIASGIHAIVIDGEVRGYKVSDARQADIRPQWREDGGWYDATEGWKKLAVEHRADLDPGFVAGITESDIESPHTDQS